MNGVVKFHFAPLLFDFDMDVQDSLTPRKWVLSRLKRETWRSFKIINYQITKFKYSFIEHYIIFLIYFLSASSGVWLYYVQR